MKKNSAPSHADSNFRKTILRTLTTLGKETSDLAETVGYDPGCLEKVLTGQKMLSSKIKNIINQGIEQLAMINAAKKTKE